MNTFASNFFSKWKRGKKKAKIRLKPLQKPYLVGITKIRRRKKDRNKQTTDNRQHQTQNIKPIMTPTTLSYMYSASFLFNTSP